MCGIFGTVFPHRQRSVNLTTVAETMAHRGPDAQGAMIWDTPTSKPQFSELRGQVTASIILTHLRLAIIDTSDAGIQPILSEDGRFALSYNGEIYNYIELRAELISLGHTFKTATDIEVLMTAWRQWGEDCLPRLVGMFAFLIYDHKTSRLLAVRDGFGIKPLYFHKNDDGISFSSDFITLIRSLPDSETKNLQQNDFATAHYLRFGITHFCPETYISGIERLGPGEVMEIDAETGHVVDRRRFFDIETIEQKDWQFAEAVTAVRDAFMESVEQHMRADVPYAATLSGGIDSSAIVCAMKEISDKPVHTFSFHAKSKNISETKWIDLVNKHVGAVSHPVELADHQLLEDLDDLVIKQGEPFGSLSIYASYKVQQEIAAQGFRVVLSGQGADELFAGYPHFYGDVAADFVRARNFGGIKNWLKDLRVQGTGVSAKWVAMSCAERLLPPSIISQLRNISGRPLMLPWYRPSGFAPFLAGMAGNKLRKPSPSYLKAALKKHIAGGALADLLRYEDRNAMAHSIENRVPFLTPKLAELALSMPDHFLISKQGETKHVFREAMRGIVPDEILERRDKIGFAPDNGAWLADERLYKIDESKLGPLADLIDGGKFLEAAKSGDITNREYGDAVWRTRNMVSSRAMALPLRNTGHKEVA